MLLFFLNGEDMILFLIFLLLMFLNIALLKLAGYMILGILFLIDGIVLIPSLLLFLIF